MAVGVMELSVSGNPPGLKPVGVSSNVVVNGLAGIVVVLGCDCDGFSAGKDKLSKSVDGLVVGSTVVWEYPGEIGVGDSSPIVMVLAIAETDPIRTTHSADIAHNG